MNPTIGGRLFSLQIGIDRSTYGPTTNHKAAMGMIEKALGKAKAGLTAAQGKLSVLAKKLVEWGALDRGGRV